MNASLKPLTVECDLSFSDTLTVDAFWQRGFKDEGTVSGLVPERIYWRGIDVTSVLEPCELEEITVRINER